MMDAYIFETTLRMRVANLAHLPASRKRLALAEIAKWAAENINTDETPLFTVKKQIAAACWQLPPTIVGKVLTEAGL